MQAFSCHPVTLNKNCVIVILVDVPVVCLLVVAFVNNIKKQKERETWNEQLSVT